ncbi:MAG TPA: inositol monophosphatase family protein [Dissulfurispiraceae bacterium]|nr:inositol monophosphatase family protein [Dissulfurispiraceae bacterium]
MSCTKSEFLNVAIAAAQRASDIIIRYFGSLSKEEITLKQASDYVTHVDKESEQAIIATVREKFPDHCFLAEESLRDQESDMYRWIIDPLDGTTNYIHGYPIFAISIALEYRKEIITGVVLDPLRNELFTAEKGSGAYLNDLPIRISSTRDAESSLVATGFPFKRKEIIDEYLALFKSVLLRVSDLRRAGAAALDLASVASGRCEAFFEIGLSPWDIAAGSLLVREAGGIITDFRGGNDYLKTGNVVAGNYLLHGVVLEEVQRVFKGHVFNNEGQ